MNCLQLISNQSYNDQRWGGNGYIKQAVVSAGISLATEYLLGYGVSYTPILTCFANAGGFIVGTLFGRGNGLIGFLKKKSALNINEYGINAAVSTIGFAAPLYFLGDPNILSAVARGAFYSLASQGILDAGSAVIRARYGS